MQGTEVTRIAKLALKVTWVTCSLLVLWATVEAFDGRPNSDAELFVVYGMGALAFPSGFLTFPALLALDAIRGGASEVTCTWLVIEWCAFSLAGYWQWFKLVPWLYRKMRFWIENRRKGQHP